MASLPQGTYLFTHYHYDGDAHAPQLTLRPLDGGESFRLALRGNAMTVRFDTTTRYCTGWHDLTTGESHPCPTATTLDGEYHECRSCRDKTGFNPAFYHTDAISEQQQTRNKQPHILYLAHFGAGVVKVGISWEKRGIRRLLDQGARSYSLLGTFPSANIARQYEAKIARLPGIAETIQLRQKRLLLNQPYHFPEAARELQKVCKYIADEIIMKIDTPTAYHLDHFYVGDTVLAPGRMVDLYPETKIAGTFLGMIGSILLAEQDDTHYLLPITKFRGYTLTLHSDIEANQHTPQQVSLF